MQARLARQLPTAAAVVEVRAGFNKNNRERALPNLLFPCLASSFSSPCAPCPPLFVSVPCLLLLQCPSSSWRAALWLRPPPRSPVSLLSLALGAVAVALILCVGDGGSDVPEDISFAYLSQVPVNITLADPFQEFVHTSLSLFPVLPIQQDTQLSFALFLLSLASSAMSLPLAMPFLSLHVLSLPGLCVREV